MDENGLKRGGERQKSLRSDAVTPEELIAELQRLDRIVDGVVNSKHLNRLGRYSTTPYYRIFDSFSEARKAAGVDDDPFETHREPNEKLLSELKRVADELGRTPSIADMVKHGEYGPQVYKDRFESWNAAKARVGLGPSKSGHDGDCVRGENHPDWKGGKRTVECAQCGGEIQRHPFEIESRERHFCSKDCQGGWMSDNMVGENHPMWGIRDEDSPNWNGGKFPYGPGFGEAKKEAVRERDDRRCQYCGKTEEQHIKEMGKKHHVHHIINAKKFDDPEKRNAMDNLVTLCQGSCHKQWEGINIRPHIVTADD